MYDAVCGMWRRVFGTRSEVGATGGHGRVKPTNSCRSDRDSPSQRDRWLCLAMGGAAFVVALTLGLRLIFALTPTAPTPDDDADALADALAAAVNASDAADADAGLPGACGATCGHVLCANVRDAGGVAGVLRRYLLDLKYFEACGLPSPTTSSSVAPPSQRVVFRRSSFRGATLVPGWLDGRLRVNDVQLLNCGLRRIRDNAFNNAAFAHTHGLMLEGNELETLGPRTFTGLHALKVLVITRNSGLKSVSPNVLRPVATSLRILTVQYTLNDPQQLTGLTGSVRLPTVEKASFSHNNLEILSRDSFKGLLYVDSLSLKDSNITSLTPGIFDVPSKSLRELSLQGNRLKTVMKSVLEPIAAAYIELHDNPWNCTCSLEWFSEFILRRQLPKQLAPQLICASPLHNRGIPLLNADFCPSGEENSADVEPIFRFVIEKANSSARIVRVPQHSEPTPSPSSVSPVSAVPLSYLSLATDPSTEPSTFTSPSSTASLATLASSKSATLSASLPPPSTYSSVSAYDSTVPLSRLPGEIQIPCGNSSTESRLVTINRSARSFEGTARNEEDPEVFPAVAAAFTISRTEKDAVEVAVHDVKDLVYWYPKEDEESERLPGKDTGCVLVPGGAGGAVRVAALRPKRSYVICLANGTEQRPTSEAKCIAVQTAEDPEGSSEATQVMVGTPAASNKLNYLLAIGVLVVLLVGLTFYVMYGFLCRERSKEENRHMSARTADGPDDGGKDGKKGIFWLSDNGKLCTDVQTV